MNVKSWGCILFAGVLALAVPGVSGAKEAGAPSKARVVAPDPVFQIKGWVHQFRVGDVAGLAQAMIPPARWEEVRSAYDIKRQKPIEDAERTHFAEQLERFTAPDAVEVLMAEIEPRLVDARAQWPGMLMMGMGAAQMAVASPDVDLSPEQRDALKRMLPGLQQWAATTDFLDAATLRQAFTLLADAVRRTGIRDLDMLRQLPLEAALDRAGPLLLAGKDALRLYGLDLDAVVDSLQVDVLANDGRSARVRTRVTVFGAAISGEHELVLIEGRWYDASALKVHVASDLAMTAGH